MPPAATAPGAAWDIWCRVIDNHGDLGVCWRLAGELAARGLQVRLFVDDASALAWMAPAGHEGVVVCPWPGEADLPEAGDVVIEAFGCDPPAGVVAAMSERTRPPIWLNLEYLSAESYVERSHALPSPQRGGLTKWFFYPGFTGRTGGLLREDGLLQRRAAFDGDAWLAARGWARRPGETVVSLFCYAHAPVPALLQRLAAQPTLLLATPGHAQTLLQAAGRLPAGVRLVHLPWLTQPDYDLLLWACDLNFVRGEDSLARAVWAGAPFAWHIYPQDDGAHGPKLQALLDRLEPPDDARAFVWAWNGLASGSGLPALPALAADAPWAKACTRWRAELAGQAGLATQLLDFVADRAVRSSGFHGSHC
jgi:uncharacterized repeat protein (TIGR03837 family)